MSNRTSLELARDLIDRGFAVIPVPDKAKVPRTRGWQALRLTKDNLHEYFSGKRSNIGVLLGEPSGWIVDVDLDHQQAVELAEKYLPHTDMVWGRESRPRSHRLYRLTCPADTRKWTSKTAGMIVELRSTGCQTIAPGSTHESGEAVRWDDDGEPATVDHADLIASLEALAEAVRGDLGKGPGTTSGSAPRSASSPARGGGRNYGREALRREAAKVAATPEGGRNDALNRAAFIVGKLIGGGEVDRADAESQLLAAARACGLPDADAVRTINSGVAAGMEHPWQRPAAAGDSNASGRAGAGAADMVTSAPAPTFSPIPASELVRDYPELRPVVVEGILRAGETMNVVAAPKVGKSWLVHALAAAVISGTRWLGKSTTKGRVLLIDGELHCETLARRLRTTQSTLAVPDSDMASLQVWPVRGQRLTIDGIAAALDHVPPGEYRLIIIDALYRFLPLDGEENANETMTRVYNTLDGIAKSCGASVVVVHHATKGNQSDKAVTDVGAGAGSQSRAADTHLILRPHEEEDAVVVDAVVRSFPPMDSFVIQSTKPGWVLVSHLEPSRLKGRRGRSNATDPEKTTRAPVRQWTPEDFAAEVVGRALLIRDEVIARGSQLGLSKGQASSLLKRAESLALVHRHKDGPCQQHRFSIDPPSRGEGGQGGRSGTPPAPGADAPGGVGGTRAPPLPPQTRLTHPDQSTPPASCRSCNGERWWRGSGSATNLWTCAGCHPPQPELTVEWHERGRARSRASGREREDKGVAG